VTGRARPGFPISRAWIAVWRRNYLVWKKLAAESVLGNIIEPLFYLVGFGFGLGAMVPRA
jgi:lipooligosaccharide transport system permease protein